LESANHVDLFFAYGRTWRTTHATPLRQLIERNGTRLRVVLPDRDDEALMRQLSAKFRYSEADLIKNIDDAEADIANLHRLAAPQARSQFDALWNDASVRPLGEDHFA
jgi:hypothetical protein